MELQASHIRLKVLLTKWTVVLASGLLGCFDIQTNSIAAMPAASNQGIGLAGALANAQIGKSGSPGVGWPRNTQARDSTPNRPSTSNR